VKTNVERGRVSRRIGAVAVAVLLLAPAAPGCATERETSGGEPPREFKATAYTVEGETAAGTRTSEGIVAADPDVLPLGTRIRILDAGPFSGEYVVKDTGRRVDGRHVDVFVESESRAKEFGERTVRVEVVDRGSGQRSAAASEPLPEAHERAPAVR